MAFTTPKAGLSNNGNCVFATFHAKMGGVLTSVGALGEVSDGLTEAWTGPGMKSRHSRISTKNRESFEEGFVRKRCAPIKAWLE